MQLIYVMTHDSIGLGEDGPTHQPIEKYMTCRATPNLLFIRPADGNESTPRPAPKLSLSLTRFNVLTLLPEASGAYLAALKQHGRPTVLSLSRQNVTQLNGTTPEAVLKGAYVLVDAAAKADVIICASGSEVELAVKAAEKLTNLKVRVVSFPSWELFEEQIQEYKDSVFTPGTKHPLVCPSSWNSN